MGSEEDANGSIDEDTVTVITGNDHTVAVAEDRDEGIGSNGDNYDLEISSLSSCTFSDDNDCESTDND